MKIKSNLWKVGLSRTIWLFVLSHLSWATCSLGLSALVVNRSWNQGVDFPVTCKNSNWAMLHETHYHKPSLFALLSRLDVMQGTIFLITSQLCSPGITCSLSQSASILGTSEFISHAMSMTVIPLPLMELGIQFPSTEFDNGRQCQTALEQWVKERIWDDETTC